MVFSKTTGDQSIPLRPYFRLLEDDSNRYNATKLLNTPELFGNIAGFNTTKPNNVFWLLTYIKSNENKDVILSFKNLSYADLYILPDTNESAIEHHQAGAFRPKQYINTEDGRFHFYFKMAAGVTYRILIRSHHTKLYKPILDFELSSVYQFTKNKQKSELIDFWFQGAALFLLLYVIITWAITRFRPYLWLAIFITGLILYHLALNRYFVDWVFPANPILGLRLTIHFLHLAIVGLYLLILDFWKINTKHIALYRFGKAILYGIILVSVLSFFILTYSTNFKIMSQLNGLFFLVQAVYLLRTLMLWKTFDRQERFLAYGVIVYLLIAFFVTILLFIIGENVFSLFALLSGIMIIVISLLFLTGINGKLWENQKQKTLYLAQLNELQLQQNHLLEKKVSERTNELYRRNEHIELLMNELNHRVKNNLQLLYSLNSLQLTNNKDNYTASVLKDNIARIKAMMLANESLQIDNYLSDQMISPASFITEIVEHAKTMFTQPAHIQLTIDKNIMLNATAGLCVGLIITELITNSYKHAFPFQKKPQIIIEMKQKESLCNIHYCDNGTKTSLNKSDYGFGLTLISDLIRQLKGHYTVNTENGLTYSFQFPNPS